MTDCTCSVQATVRWAMLDPLEHPAPGFEEVVRAHFRIKRKEILAQVGCCFCTRIPVCVQLSNEGAGL